LEAESLLQTQIDGRFSPLSEAAFGLRPNSLLSIKLPQDIDLKIIGADHALSFYSQHASTIYGLDRSSKPNPFLAFEPIERKINYYALCGDFYGFFSEGRLVGVFAGNTVDWSSYYFRNCSILPRFQGLGIYSAFLKGLITILHGVGVARITGDVAASNLGHVHVLNRLGFRVTGVNLSERWGALTQFTLILASDAQSVFDQQFCYGRFGKEDST
jgi:RimJ/RimL family protein N-acetyltransferase